MRRTLTGAAAAALVGAAIAGLLLGQALVPGDNGPAGLVPIGKGKGFLAGRAAVINSSGLIDAPTDTTLSDCVHVDGGASPCAAAVTSVFGRSGAVVATGNDYSFFQIAGVASASQVPALGSLTGLLGLTQMSQGGATIGQVMSWDGSHWVPATAVTTIFGRSGAVVAATNDYAFSQISGVAGASQIPALSSINGLLALIQLAQEGATTGQVLTWNGTQYVPLDPTGGGGMGVATVFGRSGGVTAQSGDYSFSLISGVATAGQVPALSALNGSLALTQLAQTGATLGQVLGWDGAKYAPTSVGAVSTVFGRTGAVVGATNDYSFSQLSGTAAAGQLPGLSSLNGSLGLTQIAQGGATLGQVLAWDGSKYAPANSAVVAVPSFADDEVPTQVDALDYTLAHTPSPVGSLQVFVNGLRMIRGVDYTLTGGGNTVSFITAYATMLTVPVAPNSVIAVYRY